ncbi:DUF4442 domain-containing protein [Urechidicola sp. KH5]
MAKLPSAYLAGVRVKSVDDSIVVVRVKHKWMNQNPFKSMYWAVQGMASELTTGMLVMRAIAVSGKRISMLVTGQNGAFYKKATGVILFDCQDADAINQAIAATIKSGEGQKISLTSKGVNETGEVVSEFTYEWSIKLKQ